MTDEKRLYDEILATLNDAAADAANERRKHNKPYKDRIMAAFDRAEEGAAEARREPSTVIELGPGRGPA